MRRWIFGIAFMCMTMSVLVSCDPSTTSSHTAADGLSLHAVATLVPTLVRQARDGEHFEQLLNTSGINNLDLDADGNRDYINIKEYGDSDFRGFSLSTTLHEGSVQQIAEIQFQRTLSGITFQIHGNPQIYGNNYYIRSAQPITTGQAVFVAWLFTPRIVFMSPYNRLYLPPAYIPVRVVPVVEYRKVTKTVVTTTKVNVEQVQKSAITTTVKSPNEGKSSPVIVAPLANPTQTQKQFLERPETKQIQQATGFAKPKPADAIKPAVQKTQPTEAVQTSPPASGIAPTTSGRTTTDKQFQERSDKEIPQAKGFGKKPDPITPPQVTPRTILPAPIHTAPAPLAPTPMVSSPAPTSPPLRPALVHPTPQAPATSTPAPRPSKTEEKKR